MSEPLGILLPENVRVFFQPAHVFKRAVASLIDVILILIILAVIWMVLWVLKESFLNNPAIRSFLASAELILCAAVAWGYNVYYELNDGGQTPGKKYLRIRVICTDGSELSVGDSGIRNILRIADFVPFCYLLGGIVCLITPHGQRLGDLVAGTAVITEPEA
ncbi:RDD family protein [bacterium]|nr:RDD family protein [bacterium]